MPRLSDCHAALAALADLGIGGFQLVPDAERDREPSEAPPPIDFAPVRAAGHQLARWVLDTASSRTADPDDLAAIKRVRRAVDRAARGVTKVDATEHDLLTVAGVLIACFEREFQSSGLSHLVGALYANTGAPVLARVLAQLRPPSGGVVPKVARASGGPISIALEHRPCVAHGVDDAAIDDDTDVTPFALLTFR